MEKYSHYTADNLRTLNVMGSPDMGFVFVDTNHPVVNLLRMNKEIVGIDVDAVPAIDKRFIKMSKTLFESFCETIILRVIKRILPEASH